MTRKSIYDAIEAERERQIAKGYTSEHDDRMGARNLSAWAASYADAAGLHPEEIARHMEMQWGRVEGDPEHYTRRFVRATRREKLIAAAALCVAAVEALEREEAPDEP